MNCELNVKLVEKNGKKYKNLILKTPSGVNVEISLKFANPKLVYKITKEIENNGK